MNACSSQDGITYCLRNTAIRICPGERGWTVQRADESLGPFDLASASAVLAHWGVEGSSDLLTALTGPPSRWPATVTFVRMALPPVHAPQQPSPVPTYLEPLARSK